MVWPVIPLFWIPVHGISRIFKRLGLLTYVMPILTWLPLAYLIYRYRDFLLQFRVYLPLSINIFGAFLMTTGSLLHIWTGKLLGFWGLIGLPEVFSRQKGRLVTEGPFSWVRHPTYLAHTVMFSGIFFMTEVITVGILTLSDFLIVNLLIIPLEEKELSVRFGKDYSVYKEKVPYRFFPGLWQVRCCSNIDIIFEYDNLIKTLRRISMTLKNAVNICRLVFVFMLPALLITSNASVFAHGKKAKPLPHFKEGITKVSEKEHFSVEIVPEPQQPKTGKNVLKVYLHDSEGKDLEGAKVELEVWSKDKNVMSKEKPKTRETEHGEYIIKNVIYDSPGLYELRVKVTSGTDVDITVFEVEVK